MSTSSMLRLGAVLAALAVALGAFGAHGLAAHLEAHGQIENYQTAVRYQMWHALAILGCAALRGVGATRTGLAAWCFALGAAVFSGTLYAMALGGPRMLGAITPIGGVLLLIGWVALATGQGPNKGTATRG
ncbi:MAG: DUF423 domain-containing protein [Planctomycetota bacterium]